MSGPLLFTELLHVRIDGHWNLIFCSNLLVAIASWLVEGHAYLLDLCNSTDIFYVRHRIRACGGSDESLLYWRNSPVSNGVVRGRFFPHTQKIHCVPTLFPTLEVVPYARAIDNLDSGNTLHRHKTKSYYANSLHFGRKPGEHDRDSILERRSVM
jgi:hypothetical protein